MKNLVLRLMNVLTLLPMVSRRLFGFVGCLTVFPNRMGDCGRI